MLAGLVSTAFTMYSKYLGGARSALSLELRVTVVAGADVGRRKEEGKEEEAERYRKEGKKASIEVRIT